LIDSPPITYTLSVNSENEIDSIKVNGQEVALSHADLTIDISLGSIFPNIRIIRKCDQKRIGPYYLNYKIDDLRSCNLIPEVVNHFLKKYLGGNEVKILDISTDLLSREFSRLDSISLKSMPGFKSWSNWKKFIDRIDIDKDLRE
jgi:hypothetical protein